MKKIIYILLGLCFIIGCSDDNKTFDVDLSSFKVEFEPIAGGAIMKYQLPNDGNISSLNVKYKNFKGEDVFIRSSYLADSIELRGFIDQEDNIPISIFLEDQKGIVSKSIEKSFSSKASSAKAILQDIQVISSWNGFEVKYDHAPLKADGLIYVGFVGISPETNELDTLLLSTSPISSLNSTLIFSNTIYNMDKSSVVIWTEDAFGNFVEKVIKENIDFYQVKLLVSDELKLVGNDINSIEDEDYKVGWKYLFDGDKNGTQYFKEIPNELAYSFMSEPYEDTEWVIDLGSEYTLASLRIYEPLGVKKTRKWPYDIYDYWPNYHHYMPCAVEVYASNDKENWVYYGEKTYDDYSNDDDDLWCHLALTRDIEYKTLEELENAESCYMEVPFKYSLDTYRYVKLVVTDIYDTEPEYEYDENEGQQVWMHEIEVYIKK